MGNACGARGDFRKKNFFLEDRGIYVTFSGVFEYRIRFASLLRDKTEKSSGKIEFSPILTEISSFFRFSDAWLRPRPNVFLASSYVKKTQNFKSYPMVDRDFRHSRAKEGLGPKYQQNDISGP